MKQRPLGAPSKQSKALRGEGKVGQWLVRQRHGRGIMVAGVVQEEFALPLGRDSVCPEHGDRAVVLAVVTAA